MHSSRTTGSLLRRGAVTLAATALIGCTIVAPSFAAPAGDSSTVAIPSADDVERAQDDADAAAGLVTDIEEIIAAAGRQLQETQLTAFKAQSEYNNALAVLDERRSAAAQADKRAAEAARRHDAAEQQVGRLAGDLYRSGGMNPGIESVLDGTDPDEVMYRASTLYGLSSSSTRTLEDAQSASAAWASLTEDAAVARQAAQDAADAAEKAGEQAREAAGDAEQLVAEKQAQRSALVGQLATLRNTTAELEDKRIAGLEQAQRERDLARMIAESAAAATAAAVEPQSTPTSTPPLRDPASLQAPARSTPERTQQSDTAPAASVPLRPSPDRPVVEAPAPPSAPAPARPAAPTPAPARPVAPAPAPPAAPTPPARPVAPAPARPVAPAPAPAPPAPAPPAPAPPAPPASSGAGAVAMSYALSKTGNPYYYAWGGNGPLGYDCSGLTQQAFASAGVSLPRTAAQQYFAVRHIPLSQMQPGDLVFWGSGAAIWHVAIYIGGNQVVNALNPTQGILVTNLADMGGMGPLNPSAGRI